MKTKQIIFTEIVKQKIIPMLERGSAGERIELGADDCDSLLFVLRTSVPLEPFLDLFSQMTKATIIPPGRPQAVAQIQDTDGVRIEETGRKEHR